MSVDTKWRPLMVRLPPDIDDRLRYFAMTRERPLSWVIRKALSEYLDRYEMDGSSASSSFADPQFMPQALTINELLGRPEESFDERQRA